MSRSVIRTNCSRLGRLSNVRCMKSSWRVGSVSAAKPLSNGVNSGSALRYTLAEDSYFVGTSATPIHPAVQTSQAVATPSHLWRHTACNTGMAWGGKNLMNGSNPVGRGRSSAADDRAAVTPVTTGRSGTKRHRLEQALRNNQDVARLK